ncbi:hypothetical protein [Spirosoma sp. KUDC1026]|uniref:hypothetical protein n=1 Tax=Spirosoma sp. KUDC1026 TaxID=2745947 RepID=UPI00159B947E|nr:hypothetical protein [Spirosoma sp. KUDC1026]QKZ15188.1 hypothetical protein HU175_22205 [Spirosoma sp. KUDC1026]
MLKPLNALGTDIAQIKNESQTGANTAPRVGGALENLKDSGIFEYDPAASYVTGQLVWQEGVISKALTAVTPNQPPNSSDPTIRAKWSAQIAGSKELIVLGNQKPVSANALAELLATGPAPGGDVPQATTAVAGKARIATQAEFDAGTSNDLIVTPLLVKTYLDTFLGDLADLSPDDEDGLNALLGKLFRDADITTLTAIATIIKPYIGGGSGGTQSLDTLMGYVTSKDISVGGIIRNKEPVAVNDFFGLVAWYYIQGIGYAQERVTLDRLKELVGTGNGSGGSGLSDEDIENLSQYGYLYDKWLESDQTGPKPVKPTLSGGSGGGTNPPATTATINANLSKYEADGPGLTIQANCSNGENFMGQVTGVNGAAVPDSTWHLLSRIDGNIQNGTYAFPYANLPTGGILEPGDYIANVRIGVDNATIVPKPFTVVSNVPVPLNGAENFRIVGNAGPLEGVQGEVYALERRWSDNTWRTFSAPDGSIIYSPDAPGGVAFGEFIDGGIRKGALSANADAITQDTIITLIFFIGFNVQRQVTLKNTSASAPVKKINFVSSSDVSGVGRVGVANVTVPVQAVRQFFIVQNGVDAFVGVSDIRDAVLKAGSYDPTGATVEIIWGAFPYSNTGTYKVIEAWRPAGVAQEPSDPNDPNAFVRNPPYTVVVGTPPGGGGGGGNQETTEWEYDTDATPPNTAQRIEYRFVKSGGVNGNYDRLEFRMADTYPDSPMYIDLQLASGSYNFGRGFQRTSTVDSETGSALRIALYDTGSYAGKNLKVGISQQTGTGATLLFQYNIVVPTTTMTGYTRLYPA